MRCRELLLNYGKPSIRQFLSGCQETTNVMVDLYPLLVSLYIFTLAHTHYILESFYQLLDAVAKVFEISHVFL